jgi:tryptophan-rich sensory protein
MSAIMKLVFSLIICFAAAGLGGIATANSLSDWYIQLNKPIFNPPNWIFGPVWSLLYFMMALALWKVWCLPISELRNVALFWFFTQLMLNVLWSFLFFHFQWPFGAFVEILLLWTAILITIIKFYALIPWTLFLLLPYLLWVSFATLLNAAISWLNMT